MDSLAMRNPLYSVSRESYGGAAYRSVSGSVSEEAGVGIGDPGVEPGSSGMAVVGSYRLWRGRKVYELKNHLGNVLAVVSDVKIGVGPTNVLPSLINYYTADVVEMSDYEPFGMLLSKRHWVSGEGYRFGFNGKEGDDEWNGEGNMYNYGFRIHDPRLGRFLSVDPLAHLYVKESPYSYALNSPNRLIDVDGKGGGDAGASVTNNSTKHSITIVGDGDIFYGAENDMKSVFYTSSAWKESGEFVRDWIVLGPGDKYVPTILYKHLEDGSQFEVKGGWVFRKATGQCEFTFIHDADFVDLEKGQKLKVYRNYDEGTLVTSENSERRQADDERNRENPFGMHGGQVQISEGGGSEVVFEDVGDELTMRRYGSDGEEEGGIYITLSDDPLTHGKGSLPKSNTNPLGEIIGVSPGTGRAIPVSKLNTLNWNKIENEAKKQ